MFAYTRFDIFVVNFSETHGECLEFSTLQRIFNVKLLTFVLLQRTFAHTSASSRVDVIVFVVNLWLHGWSTEHSHFFRSSLARTLHGPCWSISHGRQCRTFIKKFPIYLTHAHVRRIGYISDVRNIMQNLRLAQIAAITIKLYRIFYLRNI